MRRLESFRAAAKYGSRDTRAFASDAPERSSTGKSRDAFGSGGLARSRPDAGRNAPSAKSLGYEVSRIEAPRVRLRIREVSRVESQWRTSGLSAPIHFAASPTVPALRSSKARRARLSASILAAGSGFVNAPPPEITIARVKSPEKTGLPIRAITSRPAPDVPTRVTDAALPPNFAMFFFTQRRAFRASRRAKFPEFSSFVPWRSAGSDTKPKSPGRVRATTTTAFNAAESDAPSIDA